MLHHRSLILCALLSTGAYAQWLNYPTPGTPRTPDGKPNLTAPAPRAADGKPDLSGVWHVQPNSREDLRRHRRCGRRLERARHGVGLHR